MKTLQLLPILLSEVMHRMRQVLPPTLTMAAAAVLVPAATAAGEVSEHQSVLDAAITEWFPASRVTRGSADGETVAAPIAC